jgi:3-dehydroquinate dehydratase II
VPRPRAAPRTRDLDPTRSDADKGSLGIGIGIGIGMARHRRRKSARCAARLPRLSGMTASLVYVLNGPNLNRLGGREPEIYGSQTLQDVGDLVSREADSLGLAVDFRQTNDEAELIGWIHEAVDCGADVVLNPAAFTHYSYAVRDACAMVTTSGAKLIEIHLTNPATREQFRHTSVIAGVATGTIAGFGSGSYLLALRALTLRRPAE